MIDDGEERRERRGGGNGNAADSDEGFYHLSVGPATQTGRLGRPVREGGKARQGKARPSVGCATRQADRQIGRQAHRRPRNEHTDRDTTHPRNSLEIGQLRGGRQSSCHSH